MEAMHTWLLEGDPWVQYHTLVDLLKETQDSLAVQQARKEMLAHPQINQLVQELQDWPVQVISSHRSAGHPLHKLNFLAELGFTISDSGISRIVEKILEHQDTAGPFQVLMNVSKYHGGSGEDTWAWALCDVPLLLYALIRFGLGLDSKVQKAIDFLSGLVRENGWPCAVSNELGSFRGPGRKDDPCPFANLAMLKALSAIPGSNDCTATRLGCEAILRQWETREVSHPYMFYMGTDFCKLKAPMVWYDILHVTDVLSSYKWLQTDPRLDQMIKLIKSKANVLLRYTPESVWTAWKDWEFGQKKEPSRWLTLHVLRIQKRMEV